MTEDQICEAISKIVDTYYGIDTYGILSILSKDYGYDYIKDNKFEKYLKKACKKYNIIMDHDGYYISKTYSIPVTLYGRLNVDTCDDCYFKLRTSDIPQSMRDSIPSGVSDRRCALDLSIEITRRSSTMTPKTCPRMALYKKIFENETSDVPIEGPIIEYPITADTLKDISSLEGITIAGMRPVNIGSIDAHVLARFTNDLANILKKNQEEEDIT